MPFENKMEEVLRINNKRLSIFKENGIEVKSVEDEVKADMQTQEKIEEVITTNKESEEEEEDRDPREANHSLGGERKLF